MQYDASYTYRAEQSTMGLWRSFFDTVFTPFAQDGTPSVPNVLYKYIPVERCHHWLVEKRIGFAALGLLNDPYEGVILSLPHSGADALHISEDSPIVKYRVGQIVDYGVNPNYDPMARSRRVCRQNQRNQEVEAKRSKVQTAIKNCRILSLARTPKNMVMWAHYASNSHGICIGIDHVKANLADKSGEPIKPITVAVKYKDHPFSSRFDHNNEDPIAYALGRKHTDWAYEREVRIIRHVSDFEEHRVNKLVGLAPLLPETVTEVILGSNVEESLLTMLREQISHFPNARIGQIEHSSDSYSSRIRKFDLSKRLK